MTRQRVNLLRPWNSLAGASCLYWDCDPTPIPLQVAEGRAGNNSCNWRFVLASPRRQPCGSNHDRRPCHVGRRDTRTADAHTADTHTADTHTADAHTADTHTADTHTADAHTADTHTADTHTADTHTADTTRLELPV
jgi:hypothetical protein